MSLLRGNIKDAVGSALSGLFLDATLTRNGIAYDVDGELTSNATSHSVKVVEESYSELARLAGVSRDQRKFLILAKGMTVTPQIGDALTFEGDVFSIIGVNRDPAEATFTVDVE